MRILSPTLALAAVLLALPGLYAQTAELHNSLTFGLDDSSLSPEARLLLDAVAAEALRADRYTLTLAGHTDAQGATDYNRRLSAKRTDAVEAALLARGLDPDHVARASFGESRPLRDGATEDAHAVNRRVELTLRTTRVNTPALLHEALAERFSVSETIDHARGGSLRGRDGTTVDVPAGAFVRADGAELPAGARVDIRLEEATRPGAMIAHRLNTNGASGRLRTGGMVRVTASYAGEQLRLRDGAALDVAIPVARADAGMRLYLGARDPEAGTMDWSLAAGETPTASTRIAAGPVPAPRSTGMADSLASLSALLAERKALLERLDLSGPLGAKVVPPQFPHFREFPLAFDPNLGEPKRPYLGEAPTRRTVTRAGLLTTLRAEQRKADAAFVADSITYAALAPERADKLARWEEALAEFRATEPERRAAHAAATEAVRVARIEQAGEYLRDNHRIRAIQQLQRWRAHLTERGPMANADLSEADLGLGGVMLPADPHVVIARARADFASPETIAADAVGLDFETHQFELFDEYGLRAVVADVKAVQSRIRELYSDIQNRRLRESRAIADAFNAGFAERYAFQIRTPAPQWYNCDQPLPPGVYQLLVDRPQAAGVYFASTDAGTVDFYAPGSPASAVYPAAVEVDVLAFGATDAGITLARGRARAAHRQSPSEIQLEFAPSTLAEIEALLLAM